MGLVLLLFDRLGRTARAGKVGEGILVLASFEYDLMMKQELVGLPITEINAASILCQISSDTVSSLSLFVHNVQ